MRIISLRLGVALVAGLTFAPAALVAQDGQQPPPPPARPDSVELRAEREVFAYPGFERRNPFKPLVGPDEGAGPRFEVMRLRGIAFSREPGRSIATLVAGGGTMMTDAGVQQVRGQSARLRVGQRWGNVRIVEIRRDRIIVEVEEFGLSERREMRLPARSQGGSR